jgi:hypothetical protein
MRKGRSGSVASTNKAPALAALHLLKERMAKLEQQHQQRIARGDIPSVVDREIAQIALTDVVEFFMDSGIDSTPLTRLLADLEALSAGSRPSGMLAVAVTRHRRPDAPAIQGTKGRLAAIMEFQQQAGLSRKAAGEWIARHVPKTMRHQLGPVTRSAVDSWLAKWGKKRGEIGDSGREGYLHMRTILQDRRPTEAQLKRLIAVLMRSLPSSEST